MWSLSVGHRLGRVVTGWVGWLSIGVGWGQLVWWSQEGNPTRYGGSSHSARRPCARPKEPSLVAEDKVGIEDKGADPSTDRKRKRAQDVLSDGLRDVCSLYSLIYAPTMLLSPRPTISLVHPLCVVI